MPAASEQLASAAAQRRRAAVGFGVQPQRRGLRLRLLPPGTIQWLIRAYVLSS